MPIWLRKFTFNKIKQFHEEREEANKKMQKKVQNKPQIHRPGVKPTYSVKAPNK